MSLCLWERVYGKDDAENTLGDRLMGIIRRATEHTGMQAVLLVDEYEKPILDTMDDEDVQ